MDSGPGRKGEMVETVLQNLKLGQQCYINVKSLIWRPELWSCRRECFLGKHTLNTKSDEVSCLQLALKQFKKILWQLVCIQRNSKTEKEQI